jgi:tetratricopeptide (TPR) repeat protein
MSTAVIPARDPVQTALELRAQGQLRQALDALSVPGDFPADFYTLRGDLQMELDQTKEAAGSYFTVVASEPDNVYAQCNLGLCLRRLERWEQAAEALQSVLRLDPHRDEARLDLGDCLLHLNRYEEALVCFDQCWSDAARRRALFGKAVALQLLRRFDQAETCYERFLTLEPGAEEALTNLIAMCVEVFDLERIQRYSRRLLDLDPRSATALKGLALVAIERREQEQAARFFARAAELDTDIIYAAHSATHSAKQREHGDGIIEYRLSREVLDRLTQASRARAAGK